MRQAIFSSKVLTPDSCGPAWIVIEDGRIVELTAKAPEAVDVSDYGNCWISPGFVDTHIHGFFGHDTMDCDAEGINLISEALARHGTTSWLPTTLTASVSSTEAACASVAKALTLRDKIFLGARVEGIFLEGPFFSEKYKGAQNPAYLIDPDVALLDQWQKAADGLVIKSALAPERAGSLEYIAACQREGIVAAIAHTDAAFDEAMAAVDAGASVFVHTYNAMRPLNHRDPGVVGAAMTSDETYAELICDGHHVHPAAVKALVRTKGWRHVALITDALSCAGLPDGNYMLGELPIVLSGGAAHLAREGNLAGSVLTLHKAVQNVVEWGVVSAEEALRMASEIPAISCGIQDHAGVIQEGVEANLCVLDDALELVQVYVGGSALLD